MLDAAEIRSLHLHSLDSLLADLVSGHPVGMDADGRHRFALESDEARALLDWYRKNRPAWSKPVASELLPLLMTAAAQAPPELTAAPATSSTPRNFAPVRVEIVRFGGVQEYDLAPIGWLLRTLRGSSSKPRTFLRGNCAEAVVLWSKFVCTDGLTAGFLTASTQSAQELPNRGKISGLITLTMHGAKNREFDGVIVLWPYAVAGGAEQKRRLLYNAVTRAKHWCLVLVEGERLLQQAPFVA